MRLLARREHSRSELAAKLAARGVGRETAERVLAELSAESLLSDARFAQDYVRARVERGYGPQRIHAELRERGIDKAIIQQCINSVDPAWIKRLSDAYQRRFGEVVPADTRERARQYRFLVRRGFPPGYVRQLLGPSHQNASQE